ncbi:MAG TPA: hypothetical protein EYM32_04925 [Dehalococcoidia bacterium]|nr:hypothetical protein [Dehalococcoidia bacterium]
MRIKLRSFGWLITGSILLLAIGCGSAAPAPSLSLENPTQTPNIPATEAAKGPAAPVRIPTATPVPSQVSQTAQDFASGYLVINQEWDELHRDFDKWRQGLITCDSSSVQANLVRFSGNFAGTTETARSLSRHSAVRDLSDQLIKAAEGEEEALRRLRDNWKPDSDEAEVVNGSGASGAGSEDSGSGQTENQNQSVFEGAAVARSFASAIQKSVADQLSDLQEKTSPASESKVGEFSDAVKSASASWDRFHRDYDSFRTAQSGLTPEQAERALGGLVDDFRAVVLAVRDLPSTSATDSVASLLAEAVEEEDLALRLLRGALPKSVENSTESSGNDDESAGDPAPDPGDPAPDPAPDPGDPALFDLFYVQVVEANSARRQARKELASATESVSADRRAAVGAFASQYADLNQEWDAFHRDYDRWRSTEGGCDRTKAVEALGGFTLRSSELSGSVRDLPRATFLRPLGELMVEAAEREEGALRELRTSWRPFDPQAFHTLDRQRNTSGKLRRQVALGIAELLESYGIAAP